MTDPSRRLLVFGCHEAWVALLAGLGRPLDIVTGLKGRVGGWDARARVLPPETRFISIADVETGHDTYECAILHSLSDLRDLGGVDVPRLVVFHATLEGRLVEEGSALTPADLRALARRYLHLKRAEAVAVSALKARSWGLEEDPIPPGIDVAAMPAHRGDVAAGVRVANRVASRRRILAWDFHERAFHGLPIRLIGDNPGWRTAGPARSWDHLCDALASHRFYVHTADPELEDGYNLAMLEAMACGLPIVGNPHPTSPIEHGVSGFLHEDPATLGTLAARLLADPGLAARLGAAARRTVERRFTPAAFHSGLAVAIDRARRRWNAGALARSGVAGSATGGVLASRTTGDGRFPKSGGIPRNGESPVQRA